MFNLVVNLNSMILCITVNFCKNDNRSQLRYKTKSTQTI